MWSQTANENPDIKTKNTKLQKVQVWRADREHWAEQSRTWEWPGHHSIIDLSMHFLSPGDTTWYKSVCHLRFFSLSELERACTCWTEYAWELGLGELLKWFKQVWICNYRSTQNSPCAFKKDFSSVPERPTHFFWATSFFVCPQMCCGRMLHWNLITPWLKLSSVCV